MFRVRLWLGRACECVRHSPKATMIYHNNRPLNRFAPAAPQPARFFEHAYVEAARGVGFKREPIEAEPGETDLPAHL